MAKNAYVGVDAVARRITRSYVGKDNVARSVTKAYIGVDNVSRLFWVRGTRLSELEVGKTVYIKENKVSTAYIIIHQGLPSSLYDSSCDGTWLLRKDETEESVQWNAYNAGVNYGTSNVHNYLGNTFLNLYASSFANIIKEVKIPYHNGSRVMSGTSGLTTKIFLLSGYELGWTQSNDSHFPIDGAHLPYFKYDTNRSTGVVHWTRSRYDSSKVWYVNGNGGYANIAYTTKYAIRPAMILPSDTIVDAKFNIIVTYK